MAANIVRVAVGVILSPDHTVLIARRPDDTHQGGLWEFPGGKIEAQETTPQALQRELYEELGVAISRDSAEPLTEIAFDYPDKSVFLDVYRVHLDTSQVDQAHGAEGQPIAWVAAEELRDYAFPAANAPILEALVDWLASAKGRQERP